jgi:hypothetical protein
MEYDYSNISDFEKTQLPEGFIGNVYNISYKWLQIIPEPKTSIKIMEIGAYHGANICSYMKTYAKHPNTEIHCVDPWFDYAGYNEYMYKQQTNYSIFINNISKLNPSDLHKIYIHRGLSENIVPSFENESYDIIYIDGNHEKRYVVEDSVNTFKKVKKGGWIVFDDMHDKEVFEGVQSFLKIYASYFEVCQLQNSQLFMKRNTA